MILKALLFDVDGTLADTERDGHRPAFNAAFAEAGLNWHWDTTLYGELLAVTGGKERMRYYAERHDPDFLRRQDCDALIARMHASKTRQFVQYVQTGGVPLRPGVLELLQAAGQAGLTLAVVTTTTLANVHSLLAANLHDAATSTFALIAAGDVVKAKKPAPDIYDYALQQLGLRAAECLAIEDSANGLRAALAAGVPTLITTNAYTQDQDFSGALEVLPDLEGIGLDALRQWHARAASVSPPRQAVSG